MAAMWRWPVPLSREAYACAASINGVTDLQALLREKVPMYGTEGTAAQYCRLLLRVEGTHRRADRSGSGEQVAIQCRHSITIRYSSSMEQATQSCERAVGADGHALSAAGKSVAVATLSG